jgi:hypothetical protein
MLVLCYGITKSGSTLAFELVKGMLKSIGHEQVRFSEDLVKAGAAINFVQQVDRKKVDGLLELVGDRWIAVKTHAGIRDPVFPYLEELQEKRLVQIIASYRDPREICLSLADAGAHARAHNRTAFSEFTDIHSAVPGVLRQIGKFRRWGAVRGALRLDYDLVAFSTDEAIDRIEERLGIVCDRAYANRYAFNEAFTQKNKAKRHRAKEDLGEEDYAALTATFADFIQNVCEHQNDSWFANAREEILTNPAPEKMRTRKREGSPPRRSRRKRLRTAERA